MRRQAIGLTAWTKHPRFEVSESVIRAPDYLKPAAEWRPPRAGNPRHVGKPLRFELEGLHSARRGDFRIIYRIDQNHPDSHTNPPVTIIAIEHRSDAYRRR